jgi:hypothetical protein
MIGFLLFAALQQPVSPELELQIALRLYQGERVSSSVTTGKNDTVSGSIWADASMCGVGSSETASSGPDRIRWQYTARILQRSSSSYTVEIEWQRDGGPFGSAARTTQQFVLQLGQPQVLDTLTPATANACGVTTLRVDASIVPASPQDFRRFGSGGGGGRGAGASAGGFGTSAAAGGGAGRGRGFGGTAVASGATATTGGGRGGRGSGGVNGAGALANAPGGARGDWLIGGNGSALEFARMLSQGNYAWNYRVSSAAAGAGIGAARGGGSDMTVTTGGGRGVAVGPTWVFSPPNPPLTPISTGSYDAELWLVHTPPGGKEETQRVTVHVGPDGDAVAFPLVTVSTPNGPTTVDVAVALRVMADEKGANVLRVIIVRRVDGGTIASASGSSASASTGATTKVIPLPAANDTVSFELPQARAFATSALADHPFSVRLRIGAGK